MASEEPEKAISAESKAKSILHSWGTSSMPPTGLATLIVALHGRPFQPLPMLFAPMLLFSSYVNLAGFPTDSAGITAAWSGLYVLLALRRRQSLRNKFSVRGVVRGSAIGLGLMNFASGAWVYAHGDRKADEKARLERNRWN